MTAATVAPVPSPSRMARSAPRDTRRPAIRTAAASFVVVALVVLLAGCGSSSTSGSAPTPSGAKGPGPVNVLYAGSLVTLLQTKIDAAFHRATGDTVTGIPGGSTALAGEIRGGVRRADVFVSASPTTNASLEGPANGGWVTWYLTFATSPLLLGYDPSGRFARTLRSEPWWKVVTKPGFLVGRTNPVTDPKGVLVVKAVDQTAARRHDPSLRAIVATSSDVFPETAMVGRLQAGQLDAGFFYSVEASAAKIPTVPLTGVHEHATYTITVVARAPHPAAADAFVSYMVGGAAKALLGKEGLTEVTPPELTGDRSAVPESLRKVLR